MSELPELIISEKSRFAGAFVVEGTQRELTLEQAEEILHRCNCHDDLLAACEVGLSALIRLMLISNTKQVDTEIRKMQAAIAKSKQNPGGGDKDG